MDIKLRKGVSVRMIVYYMYMIMMTTADGRTSRKRNTFIFLRRSLYLVLSGYDIIICVQIDADADA